jgi:hypothetical protein
LIVTGTRDNIGAPPIRKAVKVKKWKKSRKK